MAKPVSEWKLSTGSWRLRDMLASEIIRRGPKDDEFAHAVYELMKGRVIDPDVKDDDILNLSFTDLGKLTTRIADMMMEHLRSVQSIPNLDELISNGHRNPKPS
jgi:hypothetical protein